MPRRTTQAVEQVVIRLYVDKKNGVTTIGHLLGLNKKTIIQILHRNSVPMRMGGEQYRRLYEFDREKAIELYLQRKKPTFIARALGVPVQVINSTLANRKVPRRSQHEGGLTYHCDENVFDVVTEQSLYHAGLLAADGCISGNAVTITLQDRDRDALESFREFLKSDHPIRQVQKKLNGKNFFFWSLYICSPHMVESLAKFGIRPAKTYTLKTSESVASSPAWWRGVLDGDGCLKIYKRSEKTRGAKRIRTTIVLNLSGSLPLMEQFQSFVQSRCPWYKGKIYRYMQAHATVLTNRVQTKGMTAVTLIRELYGDGCTIALQRKWDTAKRVIELTQPGAELAHLNDTRSVVARVVLTYFDLMRLKAELGTWEKVAAHLSMSASGLMKVRERLHREAEEAGEIEPHGPQYRDYSEFDLETIYDTYAKCGEHWGKTAVVLGVGYAALIALRDRLHRRAALSLAADES